MRPRAVVLEVVPTEQILPKETIKHRKPSFQVQAHNRTQMCTYKKSNDFERCDA